MRRLKAPHPGMLVAFGVLGIYATALVSLAATAERASFDIFASPYLARILWSSLLQASASTFLSMVAGMALALAAARLRRAAPASMLRVLLLTLASAPSIVVVLGVVSVYGRAGWYASLFNAQRADAWPSIYGMPGILIAHVAMNAPFAARVFLHALAQVPAEHHRIASISGFSAAQVFRFCDWPALKRNAPGLTALIMLLCFTSFAVVLTLGGGPRNATLEVAIYEALRLDVDFGRAAMLSLLQIGLAMAFVFATGRWIAEEPTAEWSGRILQRADSGFAFVKLIDILVIALALVGLAPILLATMPGFASLGSLWDREIASAAIASLCIAAPAAALCVSAALMLAASGQARGRGGAASTLSQATPLLALAAPPFALVAGLYLPMRRFGDNATLAAILVPFVNALMALPFVFRMIEPPMRLSRRRYERLAQHLNLQGRARLAIVDWPLLKRPAHAAFCLALALSLGDFGVAALFGGRDFRTLPLLLQERMGAYRLEEAQAIGLAMVALAFSLAFAAEKLSHADDR